MDWLRPVQRLNPFTSLFGKTPENQAKIRKEEAEREGEARKVFQPEEHPTFGEGVYYVIEGSKEQRKFKHGIYEGQGPSGDDLYTSTPFFSSSLATDGIITDKGYQPGFDEMKDWNMDSYIMFTSNPAVQFAKKVASSLKESYDWKDLFENPNDLIIKYLKGTQPSRKDGAITNILGQVNLSKLLEDVLTKLGTIDPAKADSINTAIARAENNIELLTKLIYSLDDAQPHQDMIARELLLNSIFHSRIIVFSSWLQGGIDSVLYEVRRLCKVPPEVQDKELFVDLSNQKGHFSTPFAESVALKMILSNKRAGYSTGVKKQMQLDMAWVQSLARLRGYRFNDEHIRQQTKLAGGVIREAIKGATLADFEATI